MAMGLLLAAMVAGASMAWRHAAGLAVPAVAGAGHAALALSAFAMLATLVVTRDTPPLVNSALLLLAFALVGGAFNAMFRLQGERPPGFMILLHALAAFTAFILLALS